MLEKITIRWIAPSGLCLTGPRKLHQNNVSIAKMKLYSECVLSRSVYWRYWTNPAVQK